MILDEVLRSGIARRKIPAVVAMLASHQQTLYRGAFGRRDSSGSPVSSDSIFQIMSMTKPITTVAALQLVEQGRVNLDEAVSHYLPALKKIQILQGFDSSGQPSLRPAATEVTLRHLLTHTSGFCYDTWDEAMFRYTSAVPDSSNVPSPLIFEPGERWQYGQGIDWAGRLVQRLSGMSLEDYFQQNIFGPLAMEDTSFILPAFKFDRLVTNHRRNSYGDLQQEQRKLPDPPIFFNGGGGLFSTAGDYVRFMQMILNQGLSLKGKPILQPATVEQMKVNQIGTLTAVPMKSFRPNRSSDVDLQPGHDAKWGFGFRINPEAYDGGRSAASLAWAGLYNTFFWIDPARDLCAVLLMQFLPFVDKEATGLLNDFEQAVYRTISLR